MKTIKGYEFKDLDKEVQREVKDKETSELVMSKMEELDKLLNEGLLAEKEYYGFLGCSKFYAETTGWFVPSCYYDKNRKRIDKEVEELLKTYLFTSFGRFIQVL